MRRTIVLAALLAGTCTAPAMAWQDAAEDPAEGEICIAIGHRWVGTADERRRISEDPVPASFRAIYTDKGCARFQLMFDSLLDWHLAYGDAASANAAVAFLENGAGEGRPVDPQFQTVLRARWQAAARDVAKLLAATKPQSPAETVEARLKRRYLAIYRLPAVEQLKEYLDRIDGYNFVASEYTRAAAYFPSAELVAGARRVNVPVAAGLAFARERTALGPVDAFLADRVSDITDNRVQSAALRAISLAVTDVALDPTPARIAKAEEVIRAHDNPDFQTFLEHGYGSDSGACEVEDREMFRDYKARCEENGFKNDASGYWFERSRLELLAEKNGQTLSLAGRDIVDATIALFQRRAWENGMRYGEGRPSLQALDLMLMRADAYAPNADRICRGEIDDPTKYLPDVLDRLIDAQTMLSPAREPRRYRRLASTYLTIHDAALRCDPQYRQDAHARNAVLMRAFLASYDQLIAGER